jgi:myosin heavy subunit
MNPLFKPTKRAGGDFISRHAVGVADMITLNQLTEDNLLDNLHMRFSEDIIYVSLQLVITST